MKSRVQFTSRLLRQVKPSEKEYSLHDANCEGLSLRVQPGGGKTWIIWERDPESGRSRRITLGHFPTMALDEARAAVAARVTMSEAQPPSPENRITFERLARACLDDAATRFKASTHASFSVYVTSQLIPAFGPERVADLTPAIVARWFHTYSRTKPGGANAALGWFTTIFNWGKANDLLPATLPNPAAPIRKNRRAARGRMLSSAQVSALAKALANPPSGCESAAAPIELLLLTGCRRDEVLGLTWEEVGPDRLHLKDAKTGPREVILSEKAQDLLHRLRDTSDPQERYVFPSGLSRSGRKTSLAKAWTKIKAAATLPADIRIHDLRHTFASHALLAGASLPVAGKLLGHATARTTQRYAHLDPTALAQAADLVAVTTKKFLSGNSKL